MTKMKTLLRLSSEDEAMEYLRKHHPRFFEDERTKRIAAIIILEFKEELAAMTVLQRTGMIAGILGMMYRMGSAALKTISAKKAQHMGDVFIQDYMEKEGDESVR